MKLASLLNPELIACGISPTTYPEAKNELLKIIGSLTDSDVETIQAALNEREELCSTVIAPGIAFPHARVEAVDDFYIIMATIPEGCTAEGHEKPVRFVCMFLMPEGESNLYLRSMASMAKFLAAPNAMEKLLATESPSGIIDLFEAAGTMVKDVVTAQDVMTKEPPTATRQTTLRQVADLMVKNSTVNIPVIGDNSEYLGMVDADMLLKVGLPDYLLSMESVAFLNTFEPFQDLLKQEQSMTAGEIMSEDYPKFMAHTPMIVVASNLVKHGTVSAPVLEGNKLVGMISTLDFVHKVVRA